jgi:anti-sigma factor RsiW
VSACLGEQLTALVDGALGHDERDRVLGHLARCPGCHGEVEALRALKARLARAAGTAPPPPASLLAALQALSVPGADPLPRVRPARSPAVVGAPRTSRGPVRPVMPPGAAGPGRAPSRRLRRSSAVGGGLVALGVGAVLVLGGSGATPASTPVDPGSPAFVVDFASTTSGVPLADPAGAVPSMASGTSVGPVPGTPASLPRR